MGPFTTPQNLLVELTHRVHSPLAAIRNALYLAGCCTDDPQVHAYLDLADNEVSAIVRALSAARETAAQGAADRRSGRPDQRDDHAAHAAAAGHITGITALGCS